MNKDIAKKSEWGCDVRVVNYLNTEKTITISRWLVVVFLFLYLNILKPGDWPIGYFNRMILFAAAYNLGSTLYIKKARSFSPALTLLFMYCDAIAVSVGLYFTGGAKSPLIFIWYLTLFAAGARFGFLKSLAIQLPMIFYYAFLIHQQAGIDGPEFLQQFLLGAFALIAVSLYGALFLREEEYAFRVMDGYHRDSITDRLTGLYNYAYFIDELKREAARSVRSGSHFSLLILDLDLFKQVNDTCGHEKGNVLLKSVAGILSANARKMDIVARYGGEEFAILMPDSNGAEMEVAERIRKKVEEAEFHGIADRPLRITISAGACTYPVDAKSVFELLDKADKGLYTAKNTGRNRTCYCK